MRLSSAIFWIPILFLIGLGSAETHAKMIFIEVEVAGQRQGAPMVEHFKVWIEGRRIRIESSTEGEKVPPHVIIYRGDRDRFYSIAPGRKAYIEVNRDLIAAFGPEMQAARREVDGQMSKLPSDQRASLERVLGVRETKTALVKQPLHFMPGTGTEQVGEFTCRRRDILRSGVKVAEMCVVSWDEIGIYADDLEVFRQLANFQRELMGARELTPLEVVPNQPLDVLVQFDGFPLYVKKLREGQYRSEIRVTTAKRIETDDSLFEVPKGYKARSAFEAFMSSTAVPVAPSPSEP